MGDKKKLPAAEQQSNADVARKLVPSPVALTLGIDAKRVPPVFVEMVRVLLADLAEFRETDNEEAQQAIEVGIFAAEQLAKVIQGDRPDVSLKRVHDAVRLTSSEDWAAASDSVEEVLRMLALHRDNVGSELEEATLWERAASLVQLPACLRRATHAEVVGMLRAIDGGRSFNAAMADLALALARRGETTLDLSGGRGAVVARIRSALHRRR